MNKLWVFIFNFKINLDFKIKNKNLDRFFYKIDRKWREWKNEYKLVSRAYEENEGFDCGKS